MRESPREIACRLAECAEAVCRHYLFNGRREGHYWRVGDVRNTPGRSLFVRLYASPRGPAGKWRDAAAGEYGDLLDIIRDTCRLTDFADVLEEARRFLHMPHPPLDMAAQNRNPLNAPSRAHNAAYRLFAMSQPIVGTVAEIYLHRRGITALHDTGALHFHPRCYYRPDMHTPAEIRPAIVAAVTDSGGRLTGVQRTWLAPDGSGKALVATPRRSMGDLLGYGVRFGANGAVMAAGEGIETMLSLRMVLPTMPMIAALSAGHLAAIRFPPPLLRLYIACDNDPSGAMACQRLTHRAGAAGIEAIALTAAFGDFNDDLQHLGIDALRAAIRVQLAPQDAARCMGLAA